MDHAYDVPVSAAAIATSVAFARVFAEHAPSVIRMLRNLGVPEPDLPDACQETFVVVYRKLSLFRGQSSLRTWICGISMRIAAGRRKPFRRRQETSVADLPAVASAQDLEREIDLRHAREVLAQILLGLDKPKRRVFVLHEIGQVPMADVAKVLGCPLRTAYARLKTARREVIAAWRRATSTSPRER